MTLRVIRGQSLRDTQCHFLLLALCLSPISSLNLSCLFLLSPYWSPVPSTTGSHAQFSSTGLKQLLPPCSD